MNDITASELREFVKTFQPSSDTGNFVLNNLHLTSNYITHQVFQDHSYLEVLWIPKKNSKGSKRKVKAMDYDYYKAHMQARVLKSKNTKVYRQLFKYDSVVEATEKYLQHFYIFNKTNFKNINTYPFPEYYLIETYTSLAFLFAQYLDDVELFNSPSANPKDRLQIKDKKTKLKNILMYCDKALAATSEHTISDLQLKTINLESRHTIDFIRADAELRLQDLSIIERADKTTPEQLLAYRIASNILALDVFGGELPVNDINSYISEKRYEDKVYGRAPWDDTDPEDYRPTPQKYEDNKEMSGTLATSAEPMTELASIIYGWCLEITDKRLTIDIIEERIKKLKGIRFVKAKDAEGFLHLIPKDFPSN